MHPIHLSFSSLFSPCFLFASWLLAFPLRRWEEQQVSGHARHNPSPRDARSRLRATRGGLLQTCSCPLLLVSSGLMGPYMGTPIRYVQGGGATGVSPTGVNPGHVEPPRAQRGTPKGTRRQNGTLSFSHRCRHRRQSHVVLPFPLSPDCPQSPPPPSSARAVPHSNRLPPLSTPPPPNADYIRGSGIRTCVAKDARPLDVPPWLHAPARPANPSIPTHVSIHPSHHSPPLPSSRTLFQGTASPRRQASEEEEKLQVGEENSDTIATCRLPPCPALLRIAVTTVSYSYMLSGQVTVMCFCRRSKPTRRLRTL